MIIFGEAHLRCVLRAYADYYNSTRTHLSLRKDTPLSREIQRVGRIQFVDHLGGLHHSLVRIQKSEETGKYFPPPSRNLAIGVFGKGGRVMYGVDGDIDPCQTDRVRLTVEIGEIRTGNALTLPTEKDIHLNNQPRHHNHPYAHP